MHCDSSSRALLSCLAAATGPRRCGRAAPAATGPDPRELATAAGCQPQDGRGLDEVGPARRRAAHDDGLRLPLLVGAGWPLCS
eukprot:2450222-Prymnesium_polylepis.2